MAATRAEVSPFGCGWYQEDEVVRSVYFEGSTAYEVLSGLICDCKGRNKCGTLGCTDLCRCEGGGP